MARQAQRHLEQELEVVNALNVFPVPDGDTGTNMLATVHESLRQAKSARSVRTLSQRLARGAMLGARGNSGVILSQLFRAQSEVLEQRRSASRLTADELARILARASELAEGAVANPVQGTMLSLLAAVAAMGGERNVDDFMQAVVVAAERAVAASPDQLPILREAGVVDSGAYGLLLVLRGWYEALSAQPPPAISRSLLGVERARDRAASGSGHPADLLAPNHDTYGYCVTLLVEAPDADELDVRRRLQELGDSVLVAAIEDRLKLHVHAPDPEPVRQFAAQLGPIARSDISNIDEQTSSGPPALPVVAVTPGEGLARMFRSLGAAVLSGGQTQNPSVAELLAACGGLARPVFLLPNNGNVLAAANEAAANSAGIVVVPTRSVPQGAAATLAYDPQAAPKENVARMTSAAQGVFSAELVTAAHAATLQGIHFEAGQTMVVLEGKLVGVGDSGLSALVERMREKGVELATLYYGAAASQSDAEQLRDRFMTEVPDMQVEIVWGDQPHALFILGFE